MQLGFAFFARSGEMNQDGIFSVLGAGLDGVRVPEVPGVIPHLCLVVRVLLGEKESGVEHRFQVQVFTPSGTEVPGERPEVPFSASEAPGAYTKFNCLVTFMAMPIPEAGAYQFRLLVDGQLLHTLQLQCQPATGTQEAKS